MNLLFLTLFTYLIYEYIKYEEIIKLWKEIVFNNYCVGTHLYLYLHIIGFTNIIRIIDILLYWKFSHHKYLSMLFFEYIKKYTVFNTIN